MEELKIQLNGQWTLEKTNKWPHKFPPAQEGHHGYSTPESKQAHAIALANEGKRANSSNAYQQSSPNISYAETKPTDVEYGVSKNYSTHTSDNDHKFHLDTSNGDYLLRSAKDHSHVDSGNVDSWSDPEERKKMHPKALAHALNFHSDDLLNMDNGHIDKHLDEMEWNSSIDPKDVETIKNNMRTEWERVRGKDEMPNSIKNYGN